MASGTTPATSLDSSRRWSISLCGDPTSPRNSRSTSRRSTCTRQPARGKLRALVLQPGTRLGPYEIESAIGAGGMGEVYRARDTRLGRSVAIKSLPATFARDPERVARFQREAQVLAALNHPHIAAIYGLEEAEGSQ